MAANKMIIQTIYVGDECWSKMWETIGKGKQPFKYIDRLEIAFANIIATDPDNGHLDYEVGLQRERVAATVKEAHRQNPNIQIIAQMGWASGLEPFVKDASKAPARLASFAKSIPPFLDRYGLKGVDFDWESVPGEMTTELATFLFNQTKRYLGDDGILSITPEQHRLIG